VTLKSLKIANATVATPYGDFTVRGLSLNDITGLVIKHESAIDALFSRAAGGAESLTPEDGIKLLQSAPELAACVIATAAGSDDQESIEIAKMLPVSAQFDALEQILKLTFAGEGGAKKVMETVKRAIQGMKALK